MGYRDEHGATVSSSVATSRTKETLRSRGNTFQLVGQDGHILTGEENNNMARKNGGTGQPLVFIFAKR